MLLGHVVFTLQDVLEDFIRLNCMFVTYFNLFKVFKINIKFFYSIFMFF